MVEHLPLMGTISRLREPYTVKAMRDWARPQGSVTVQFRRFLLGEAAILEVKLEGVSAPIRSVV